MAFAPLPFRSTVADYRRQADDLYAGWQARDADAVRVFRTRHPKFLDATIPWLERRMTEAEVGATPIDRDDAALAVARAYDFANWDRLVEHVEAVCQPGSPVARFEAAVEAVIDGDVAALKQLVRDDPDLVRARSARVNNFDPPVHRATLLHYLAANGVEGHRQRSPQNAVEVAKVLLDAGADPNALQDSYGGQNTTMAMLVSSSPPKQAGVQVPLVDTLIDYGASLEPLGRGPAVSPLMTALVHGSPEAAQALVRRGARVESLPAAAGLGRVDDVRRFLPAATPLQRHQALAIAAQLGRSATVRLLLDAGEDPNRFNPEGHHSHATPLHQAIAGGHPDTVKLLVERGARLDTRDRIFQGTPLGWAQYCGQPEIASSLRALGAT
jgi:ankyrin repeat protein